MKKNKQRANKFKTKALIDRMIRVNQAGEYGAKRIYEGQLSILRDTTDGPVLQEMKEHEQVHLDAFNKLMVDKRVRPTALFPIWHIAGFALGASTARLGKNAAMACTVAVEEVIEEHYEKQIASLDDKEYDELRETLEKFKLDEINHKEIALSEGAKETPGYQLLTRAIKKGSILAIWLSERI